MNSADRILDVIDAGLQSSDEHGYGTDRAPDRCARCQLHEPDLGDLCTGCRAFLLEDSDDDPTQYVRDELWASAVRNWSPGTSIDLRGDPGEAVDSLVARWRAELDAVRDAYQQSEEHALRTLDAGIRGAQADMVILDEVATMADLAEPIEQYLDFRRYSIRYWVESDLDRQLRQRNDMELWHYGVT